MRDEIGLRIDDSASGSSKVAIKSSSETPLDHGHIRHLDVDYGEYGHQRAVVHKRVYKVADKTLKVGLADATVRQK